MKKTKWLFGILFIIATAFFMGCESVDENDPTLYDGYSLTTIPSVVALTDPLPYVVVTEADLPSENFVIEEFALTAGQTIPVGTVTVYNTTDYLWVAYDVTVEDELGTVHIYFSGSEFTERLAPGHADIIVDATTQSVIVKVALADLGISVCSGADLYMQAHAEVGVETAYGGSITGADGGSWFGNIAYTVPANVPVSVLTEAGSLDRTVGCLETEEGLAEYNAATALEPEFLIDENYGLASLEVVTGEVIPVYSTIVETGEEPTLLYSTVTTIWTATDVCGNIVTFEQVITIMPCDTPEEPNPGDCYQDETAFAFGDVCFLEEGFNRWGWVNSLENGEAETYDVYAGAGQCDTEKGILVGTVTVSYTDGDVTFDWNIDEQYTLVETHEYAGTSMFPTLKKKKTTVAPGAYTNEGGFEGTVYVIAHAVVGFEVECPPELPEE